MAKQNRKFGWRKNFKSIFVIQEQIIISEIEIKDPKEKRLSIDQSIVSLVDP